jgi:hypothetical protein
MRGRLPLCVAVCLLAGAGAGGEDAPETLKIEARGLRIVAPPPEAKAAADPKPGADGKVIAIVKAPSHEQAAGVAEDALRPFGQLPGTTVALHVTCAKGGLIKFDLQNSAIGKFIDEKGNDLLAPREGEARQIGNTAFGLSPSFSRDGRTCALELTAPNIPAKGSAFIKIEGVISMLTASETSELVQKDVALKNGGLVTLGKHDLSIEKIGKPLLGDEPFGLTIQSQTEMSDVAEIRFLKADGSAIPARRVSTSRTQIQGMLKIEWDYALSEKVEVAGVKLLLWSNLKTLRAPFSLALTPGL